MLIYLGGSKYSYMCMHAEWLQLCPTIVTLWTVAHQAPLSLGLSRQEYWSGLPCPPPGDLPDPEIKPTFLLLLHWQEGSSPLTPPGKPKYPYAAAAAAKSLQSCPTL